MADEGMSYSEVEVEQKTERLPHSQLTARETDILKLVASGKQFAEVGQTLPVALAKRTVKEILYGQGHYRGILPRLKAASISTALVTALKQKYFEVNSIEVETIYSEPFPEANTLSNAQKSALIWEARGLSTKEIAEKLGYSVFYINHLFSARSENMGFSGIYERLGCVAYRPTSIVRALQLGIINLEDI